MKSFKNIFIGRLSNYLIGRYRKGMAKAESNGMSELTMKKLTNDESKRLSAKWQQIGIKPSHLYYEMFKTLEHFDENFMSVDVYFPYVMRSLNPLCYSRAFSHKGFYPFIFKDIPQPKFYVNNIRGIYYNSDFNVISESEAVEILKNVDSAIIKATTNSGCGDSLQKISRNDDILAILRRYRENFIVQEVLKQSPLTAQFNEPSLNSFRISTLNINGKCSLCSIIFRCGKGNTCKDNTGAGGIVIGVDPDGHFREYGYDSTYHRYYKSANGKELKNGFIPNMPQIVEQVLNYHSKFLPNIGHCGWDIALDENNNPVMIEVNLVYPGIQYEQLCNAKPHFGDRTDELIEFVNLHKPSFKLSNALN